MFMNTSEMDEKAKQYQELTSGDILDKFGSYGGGNGGDGSDGTSV